MKCNDIEFLRKQLDKLGYERKPLNDCIQHVHSDGTIVNTYHNEKEKEKTVTFQGKVTEEKKDGITQMISAINTITDIVDTANKS
ncbi:hypothetical protein [Helicobacter cetorum]|uniref:hypothetical protein n=1 Tax=Helicobacter cetorum TaxID=138563 RepID=UPI000CF15586|nr:hypothetical protein [Helicobacter cetorum]